MARRPRWVVLVLVVGAGFLGVVEIETLVESLRTHSDFRQKMTEKAEVVAAAVRPLFGARLQAGGASALEEAAAEVLRNAQAAEVEVFDGASGASVVARPRPAPVHHRLDAPQRSQVTSGRVLTVGPFLEGSPRLLTYFAAAVGRQELIVRFSTAIPELTAFLAERRQLLVAHGAAIALLLVAIMIALRPPRSSEPAPAPGILEAYEAAMERLRDRGEALSREHEAERRRMEDEIQDKEAMARAGELAAGIAHEVINGLGTILGYARLLEQSAATSESGVAARSIREECQALEVVIRRLMDYVKRETLNLASCDVSRMLQRVSAREGRNHPDCALDLDVGEVVVVGDEELLERAFENLVRNALEAAGAGGRVWITAAREDGGLVVAVADDGPGMSAAALAKLRPFYTTKASGTGLGLPLAAKIARLHQGELKLGPRSPRGLTVRLKLPAEGPR